MVDVVIDNLVKATVVRLGDLKSLRVTLSSKGEAIAEEVSPASIKEAGVIFTPGARIQETMDSVKFQKIQVLVFLL
jgi:hypothetical protein